MFQALDYLLVACMVYTIISSLFPLQFQEARIKICGGTKDAADAHSHEPCSIRRTTRWERERWTMPGTKKTQTYTDWRQALIAEVAERNRQFEERKRLDPHMSTRGAQLRPVSLRRVN